MAAHYVWTGVFWRASGKGPHAARWTRAARALLPRVQSVGLAWLTLPPWDSDRPTFAHSSLGDIPIERAPRLGAHAVDPNLFGTMGIRLVAGRGIEARDDSASAPVVVISESLAHRLGGVDRALGSELRITEAEANVPVVAQIVGVASDVAWDGFGEQGTGRLIRWGDPLDPRGQALDAFYSIEQVPDLGSLLSIAVRVAGDPAAAVAPLTRVIGSVAPLSAVHWASAMTDELAIEYRGTNFAMFLSLACPMHVRLGVLPDSGWATVPRRHRVVRDSCAHRFQSHSGVCGANGAWSVAVGSACGRTPVRPHTGRRRVRARRPRGDGGFASPRAGGLQGVPARSALVWNRGRVAAYGCRVRLLVTGQTRGQRRSDAIAEGRVSTLSADCCLLARSLED